MATESTKAESEWVIRAQRWAWIFLLATPELGHTESVGSLPSSRQADKAPSRAANTLIKFIFERQQADGSVASYWASSELFRCMRNKDLLVVALKAARLQWAAPPSVLLPRNPAKIPAAPIASLLPEVACSPCPLYAASSSPSSSSFSSPPSSSYSSSGSHGLSFVPSSFVLKPPMGCQGKGIEFFDSIDELKRFLDHDYQLVQQNNTLSLLDRKPNWVLQRHIASKLVCGNRKFHLRTHCIVLESPLSSSSLSSSSSSLSSSLSSSSSSSSSSSPSSLSSPGGPPFRLFFHREYEIRIAAEPIEWKEGEEGAGYGNINNRNAHITNGAGGDRTERALVKDISELAGLEPVLDSWLHSFWGALAPQLAGLKEKPGERDNLDESARLHSRHFVSWALCALDLMLDQQGRIWLLELNTLPAIPSIDNLKNSPGFLDHLSRMARDLFVLVTTGDAAHTFFEEVQWFSS